jgi:hypothetical protein
MMDDTIGSWAFVLVALPLMVLLVGGIAALLVFSFKAQSAGRGKGWTALVDKYATGTKPPADALGRQTIQVGGVMYKNCATVGATPDGLHLSIASPLTGIAERLQPLLIPWNDIAGVGESRLQWESVRILRVGTPQVGTITVFADAFRRIQPHLVRPPSPPPEAV